jgi:hypothetical protein
LFIMLRLCTLVLFFSFLLTPYGAIMAQETIGEPSNETPSASNNIFCTDNFALTKMSLSVASSLAEVVPQSIVGFSGTVGNQNALSVPAQELRARVFKLTEGVPALVDSYMVMQNIILPGQSDYAFTDEWQVPANQSGGVYVVEYALAFMGEEAALVGYSPRFTIISEEQSVQFVYESLTINGESYETFDQSTITDDDTVEFSIRVTNPTDEQKLIPLQWNQYVGTHPVENQRLDTKTSLLTIPANSEETISYVARGTSAKQYVVTALLDDKGAKSLLDMQISRATDEPVVLAAGVASVPVVAGQLNEFYYCIATPAESDLTSYSLALEIADAGGVVAGVVTRPSITEVAIPTFVGIVNQNQSVVTATLSKEGIPISESEAVFDCNNFNPRSCISESIEGSTLFERIISNPLFLYGGALLLLVLLILIWVAHRREHKNNHIDAMNTLTPLIITGFLIMGSLFPGIIHAQLNGSGLFGGGGLGDGGGIGGGPGSGSLPPQNPPSGGNNPPSLPNISAPATGASDGIHSFTITGTDPDGDQVRYGFDWNDNGTVDEWVPATGYVNSGTPRTVTRQWAIAGTYSYRVLVQDANGAESTMVSRNILIVDAGPPPSGGGSLPPSGGSGGSGPVSPAPGGTVSGADSTTEWIGKTGNRCGITGTEICPDAINLTVGLRVSGPASVQPGQQFTLQATGWCLGDDFSGNMRVSGGIQNGPSFGQTERIFCPSGNSGLPAGSVTLTAPTTPGQHCRTFFVQGVKIPAPFENDYLLQPTVTSEFCVNVDGTTPLSGGTCTASICSTVLPIEQNLTIAQASDCEPGETELGPLNCDYGAFFRPWCDNSPASCTIPTPPPPSGGSCTLPPGQLTQSGTTEQIVSECAASVGYNQGPDFTYAYVLRRDDGYVVCHDNPLIVQFVCSVSNTLGLNEFAYSGQPVCNVPAPVCAPPAPTPTPLTTSCTYTDPVFCDGAANGNERCSNNLTHVNWGFPGPHDPTFAATFTVNGQTNRFTIGCDNGNPGSGDCGNSQSFTLNGHTFTMGLYSNYGGGNNGVGTGEVLNCAPLNIPPPNADLSINGSNGPIAVTDTEILSIGWTAASVSNCTLIGAGLPGGAVPLTGSRSVPATAVTSSPETYILNCGGVIDSVVVNVTASNAAPNAPTIVGPVTGDTSITYPFTFTATDPDGDQLQYDVDWNNDGTSEVTSLLVNSGIAITGNRSWPTAGSYTFQVRARDIAGAVSGWTQHTITVVQASPATALLEAQINGTGPWSANDQTIDPGDTINIRWSSTGATACVGTNFSTGNAISGSGSATPPGPNSATDFSVSCNGSGGPGNDSIRITTRALPNFNQPNVTFNLSPGYDPVTGRYDSVTIIFQTTNNGGSPTRADADYQVRFDRDNNGYDQTESGSLGILNVGQGVNRTEVFTDVAFSGNRVEVTVDSSNAVTESNESDNQRVLDMTIPPPNPNLEITVSRQVVRSGETVNISWNTRATYPMNCSVFGPGINPTINFNPSVAGPTGTRQSAPINAKSEFTLRCTEPTTNTTWTDIATVEIVGSLEEI